MCRIKNNNKNYLCWYKYPSTLLPVHGDGQQATHGCNNRDADHRVEHIVHLPDEVLLHHQLFVVKEVNDDGLPGIGHTHQHVCHCQTATTRQVNGHIYHRYTKMHILLPLYEMRGQKSYLTLLLHNGTFMPRQGHQLNHFLIDYTFPDIFLRGS